LKIQQRLEQEKEARKKRNIGEEDKDRPKALERFSNKRNL
jgi:hypothetical protein